MFTSHRRLSLLMLAASASFFAGRAPAQSWISAPVVGLVSNSEQTEVRAIVGVPGASTLSAPIALPSVIARIHLAPGQRWALGEQAGGAGLALVTFTGAVSGSAQLIDQALPVPDLLSFSPNGRSAALFSISTGTFQVLTGLDSIPNVAMAIQVPDLAPARLIAVNDDGTLPVIVAGDGSVYVLSGAMPPQFIFSVGGGSGAAFLPNQTSLAIADASNGTVWVIDNAGSTPAARLVGTSLDISADQIFVQASSDGQWLIVSATGSKSAFRIDLITGQVQALDLPVSTSHLDRLRNGEGFLLSAEPDQSAWLLLGDGTSPCVVFAPSAMPPLPDSK